MLLGRERQGEWVQIPVVYRAAGDRQGDRGSRGQPLRVDQRDVGGVGWVWNGEVTEVSSCGTGPEGHWGVGEDQK